MYKAIKNFDGYSIGDEIKEADVCDRLVRSRKIEKFEIITEDVKQLKIKKPKKAKVKPEKPEQAEELETGDIEDGLLVDVSSDTVVEVETAEIIDNN